MTTSTLTDVQTRLASDHARHTTGPVFPCPLCFQVALRFGADPRPKLIALDSVEGPHSPYPRPLAA